MICGEVHDFPPLFLTSASCRVLLSSLPCILRRYMISELVKIISPRITPRVLEVVHSHLTDEQIGLLLVKLINPYIVLSQQEDAKLRGVNRKTLRGMKARGEVPSRQFGVNVEETPSCPKSGHKYPKTSHQVKGKVKPL